MTRFVLYRRAATRDNRDSESSQLARCREYIESRGWTAVAEYVDLEQTDDNLTSEGVQ